MTDTLIATPEELNLMFANEIQRTVFVTVLARLICYINTKVSKQGCITLHVADGIGVNLE